MMEWQYLTQNVMLNHHKHSTQNKRIVFKSMCRLKDIHWFEGAGTPLLPVQQNKHVSQINSHIPSYKMEKRRKRMRAKNPR